MNVHKDLTNLPTFKNAVITIGTFDGVHLGHQQIINQLKKEAEAIEGETVIITFHPHPRSVVGDTTGVKLLTTLEEKISLLQAQGINHLVIVPFSEAFSQLSAEAYIKDFLYQKFRPHTLIIGYDHKFGKGRGGDYRLLEAYATELGFAVKEIPEQVINTVTISSTQIRKSLLHAELTNANKLLGYAYFFEGTVIEGDKLGRTIGYPTANLQLTNDEKLVPGDGVYAVKVNRQQTTDNGKKTVDNSLSTIDSLNGMMYIGSRPVVNGKRRVIEVNIFDFDEDIYGQILQVTVLHYTRGDMHFNGLDELTTQLAKDKEEIQALL